MDNQNAGENFAKGVAEEILGRAEESQKQTERRLGKAAKTTGEYAVKMSGIGDRLKKEFNKRFEKFKDKLLKEEGLLGKLGKRYEKFKEKVLGKAPVNKGHYEAVKTASKKVSEQAAKEAGKKAVEAGGRAAGMAVPGVNVAITVETGVKKAAKVVKDVSSAEEIKEAVKMPKKKLKDLPGMGSTDKSVDTAAKTINSVKSIKKVIEK
jgi:hypothetical protein